MFKARARAALERSCTNMSAMGSLGLALIAYIRAYFLPRPRLALEAAALRQQLAVFKRKQPRPRLSRADRLFWTALPRLYSSWFDALILIKPETVVSWHRAGFRLFWRWRSRQPGRPRVTHEIRTLIRRVKSENPTWGAPRIHGELVHLGFVGHCQLERLGNILT
jgi:putative transposase